MNTRVTIEVIDRDGWRKDFSLERNIIYIGSGPGNDIALERGHGSGVAPRHLQLISLAAQGRGYRLVNLADTQVGLGEREEQSLPPASSIEIAGSQRIRVGDFTLIFKGHPGVVEASVTPDGPVVAEVARAPVVPSMATVPTAPRAPEATKTAFQSRAIGLDLSLPHTRLTPQRPLEGAVIVRNLGDETGVQFKLQVEGLESDCYDIGPGPILFPGASKEVPLRLRHPQRPTPPAGECCLVVYATAAEAYPGESAVVSQTIEIPPFYRHSLRLVMED